MELITSESALVLEYCRVDNQVEIIRELLSFSRDIPIKLCGAKVMLV